MKIDLPLISGAVSTSLFALSTLPMLLKAFRTKDLKSYSLGNLLLANTGNAIHSFYVFSLPPGPIWLLHMFHLLTTGLMLIWYLVYEWRPPVSKWFAADKTTAERFSQPCLHPHLPVDGGKYAAGIPHLGHDAGPRSPYAEGRLNQQALRH